MSMSQLRILIADDQESEILIARDALQAAQHRVDTATSFSEACRLAATNHYDIAVIDRGWYTDRTLTSDEPKGYKGWDIADAVRARSPEALMILYTVHANDPLTIKTATEKGMICVKKSFSPEARENLAQTAIALVVEVYQRTKGTATSPASTVFTYRPRIYIHAPYKLEPERAEIKRGILEKIRDLGFDPQEFHVSGIPKGDSWSFGRAIEIMRQCDGALILALMRWMDSTGTTRIPIPSEYSHFEGALALSCNLPSLVIAEEGMQTKGILSQMGGSFVLQVPVQNAAEWLATDKLLCEPPFEKWVEKIRARYDVFFGYCSKADELAQNIKTFLADESGLRVLDWATDFRPGCTIMEEIARATATCRCGLFLFTADDPVEGSPTKTSIPRDNVLLEAGYFMNAHTTRRMVVVREKGSKMPSDLGGMIYLNIERREDWRQTAREVLDTLRRQVSMDFAPEK
jgi:CheY-like chemotaxis protein